MFHVYISMETFYFIGKFPVVKNVYFVKKHSFIQQALEDLMCAFKKKCPMLNIFVLFS